MGLEDLRGIQHEVDTERPIVLRFGVGTIFGTEPYRTETHELSPDLTTAAQQAHAIIMEIDPVTSHLTTYNEVVELPDGSVISLDDLRIGAGIQDG